MSDTNTPILHHFEASPFSEKIRLIFGLKQIAWQSVLIPRIMPRTPSDTAHRRLSPHPCYADRRRHFLDTQVSRRNGGALSRTHCCFSAAVTRGLPWIVGLWTDRIFFGFAVLLVFGSLGDKVPQNFIDDRTKFRGAPFDVKAMAAALPHHRDQFRAHLACSRPQLSARSRFCSATR